MCTKTGTKARTKYLDITLISNALGRNICMALAGMHALTGCDTVSAFTGRDEVNALKVIKACSTYQEAMKKIVNCWHLSEPFFRSLNDLHASFIMQDPLPLMSMTCVFGFSVPKKMNQILGSCLTV